MSEELGVVGSEMKVDEGRKLEGAWERLWV